MSLYYEAASIISESPRVTDSLRVRVFSPAKSLKSPPPQLYALLVETHRWNIPLCEVIEKSEVLRHERKLTPPLALVLVHDILFAKKGLAAPTGHPLRVAVERHRVRLQGELTKIRVKLGFHSIAEWRSSLKGPTEQAEPGHGELRSRPRWVRINELKTTLKQQLSTTFAQYEQKKTLQAVLDARSSDCLYIDSDVPNLVAIPISTEITTWPAYLDGSLILQDKASCFPAYLLDPQPQDVLIDACAAPGNKTTHLAALVKNETSQSTPRIWACERDRARSEVLQRMVDLAGASKLVDVRVGQDFLRLDPERDSRGWAQATCLLLDPSCSGSGMNSRDEIISWKLPSSPTLANSTKASKKRKREHGPAEGPIQVDENEMLLQREDTSLQSRLQSLAAFQLRLILHAFTFPSARRITYSTCSEYEEENEQVVLRALASPVAKEQGWAILRREDQVEGMQIWPHRGVIASLEGFNDVEQIAEACIRCTKSTSDGTQGFFVAAFQRDQSERFMNPVSEVQDGNESANENQKEVLDEGNEEEWRGFSDGSADAEIP